MVAVPANVEGRGGNVEVARLVVEQQRRPHLVPRQDWERDQLAESGGGAGTQPRIRAGPALDKGGTDGCPLGAYMHCSRHGVDQTTRMRGAPLRSTVLPSGSPT